MGYPECGRLPRQRWNKPIAVICNEDSYSNAESFSHAIKTIGRGPIVGVPTAGGVVTTRRMGVLGESWSNGKVILAWDHVLHGSRGNTSASRRRAFSLRRSVPCLRGWCGTRPGPGWPAVWHDRPPVAARRRTSRADNCVTDCRPAW